MSEIGNMFRNAREHILPRALGVDKITYEDFGKMLGYSGKNIYLTLKRIETGEREPKGAVIHLLNGLVYAASHCFNPHIVIPEWTLMEPVDETEDDGHTIMIQRQWLPRIEMVATISSADFFHDLGWAEVGAMKITTDDMEEMIIMAHHTDYLPEPSWYTPHYEKGAALLIDEANRQY